MRRKGKLDAAGDVVSRVLAATNPDPRRGPKSHALRVFTAFTKIGPPIVDQADPVLFRKGVLTLQVAESAWMTELSFLAPQIKKRLNGLLGRDLIREVRFRLGPLMPRPEPPPKPKPLTREAKARIAAWADQIPSQDVRAAVVRAAERFAALPRKAPLDLSGPPGPRSTPTELIDDPDAPKPRTYGYGDRKQDRWKSKKPKW
ncbi:MAG: DUF721 domain-containing protein [Deltaproteobacteria bacterium]